MRRRDDKNNGAETEGWMFLKKYRKILLGVLAGICMLAVVTVGLFYFRVLTPAMFGTFPMETELRRELVLDAPLEQVMLRLMAADVQSQIMQRLGVTLLASESLEKKLNVTPRELFSGKWSIDLAEEQTVEMNDPSLGSMQLKMKSRTHARPGKIVSDSELLEPTETIRGFRQTVVMVPLPQEPGKTKIEMVYATDVMVPYPGLAFIRNMAKKQATAQHEKTLDLICEIFEKTVPPAVQPNENMQPVPEHEEPAEPETLSAPETEPDVDTAAVDDGEGFEGFEDFEGFEGFEE